MSHPFPAQADDDEARKGPPPLPAYVAAWGSAALLVATVVYYLLTYASKVGNEATRLWLLQLALTFVLFYVVIETLIVAFFGVLLPGLLKEHYKFFSDPLTIRAYPFEAKLPNVATFALATWHEELHETAIGRHCLGDVAVDATFADDRAAVAGALADEAWRPSMTTEVSIYLVSFVVALPSELQQALFEELCLAVWSATTALALMLEAVRHLGVIPRLVLVLFSLAAVLAAVSSTFSCVLSAVDRLCTRRRRPSGSAAAPPPRKATAVAAKEERDSRRLQRFSAFSPTKAASGGVELVTKTKRASAVLGRKKAREVDSRQANRPPAALV